MINKVADIILLSIFYGAICGYGSEKQLDELTLRRIVHSEGEGVSLCVTGPDGGAPDPILTYESVFIRDDHELVNISSFHLEPDETGSWSLYCLKPVLADGYFFQGDVTLLVLGRAEDNVVAAVAAETVSLRNATIALQQEGNDALRVEWSGELQREYALQFWLDSASTSEDVPFGKRESRPLTRTPTVVDTTNVDCKGSLCVYYSLSPLAPGDYAVEVLDLTDSLVQSSRSSRTTIQPDWETVAIEKVVIHTDSLDAKANPKTLSVTAKGGQRDPSKFKAVVINDLDHSSLLESDGGLCLPYEDGCIVTALETLTDPAGGEPVYDLWLLLTRPEEEIASLVSIADLHAKVTWVSPGSVQVSWEAAGVTTEFSVQLIPDKGSPLPPSNVICGLRGTVCQVAFADLVNGYYTAKVSYEADVPTDLTVRFQVTDGGTGCGLPFEMVNGRCILLDNVFTGTWHDMKHFCSQMGGQLAKIDGQDFMYDIVKFINDNGLTSQSLWIGGSDADSEGVFLWLDGEEVRLGTPYWSYYSGTQRPQNDPSRNCVAMSKTAFYYFSDEPCNAANGALCEKI